MKTPSIAAGLVLALGLLTQASAAPVVTISIVPPSQDEAASASSSAAETSAASSSEAPASSSSDLNDLTSLMSQFFTSSEESSQSSSEQPSASDSSSMESDVSSSSEEPSAPPAGLIAASNPQSVLDELSNLGYPGKLGKLDDGRASISLRIAGLNTYIDFYDCADDMTGCDTLLFGADILLKKGATLDQVNQWNSQQITGRVWTDDKGNPTLDTSLSTFDGISPEVFDENVKLWAQVVDDFKSFFNFR